MRDAHQVGAQFPLPLALGVGHIHTLSEVSICAGQLPLVVAMQERVWGSPHCKVTTARVHQDVELSEKGERKDIADRRLWTHRPVVLVDLSTE